MNLLEVREDIKVILKVLKKEYRERNRIMENIKKVEEFNNISGEVKKIDISMQLLNTILWILQP